MITRRIQRKEVLRGCIGEMKLAHAEDTALLFATRAVLKSKKGISSADSQMFDRQCGVSAGDEIEGRLRIDFVSDTTIRVRYGEGTDIPVNDTPMVFGTLDPSDSIRVDRDESKVSVPVVVDTGIRTVNVEQTTQRIRIADNDGATLCGIGDPEKDYFGAWDSFNTGICRTLGDGRPLGVKSFDLGSAEHIDGLGEQ